MSLHKTKSVKNHALSLFYGFCQLYETKDMDLFGPGMIALLSDDIVVRGPDGTFKGRQEYLKRFNILRQWSHAFHVHDTDFKRVRQGLYLLTVKLVYQNILPDWSESCYAVTFLITLRQTDEHRLIISEIETKPVLLTGCKPFESSYHKSRALSFMHYWFYCLDTAKGDASVFKNLLAGDFSISINGEEALSDWVSFEAWIREQTGAITDSVCYPTNFLFKTYADDLISFNIDLLWKRIHNTEERVERQSFQTWYLQADQGARFARLKNAEIRIKDQKLRPG